MNRRHNTTTTVTEAEARRRLARVYRIILEADVNDATESGTVGSQRPDPAAGDEPTEAGHPSYVTRNGRAGQIEVT